MKYQLERQYRSKTWDLLKEQLTLRLAELREQNDDAPPERTERIRGRIAEIKDLLALDKELPDCKPASHAE